MMKKKFFLIAIFLASMIFAISTYLEQNTPVSISLEQKKTIEIVNVNRQPFFPFGFYYASVNANERLEALRNIASAGFNTIFIFWQTLDNYEEFLDEAKRLGVHVITELKRNDITIVNQFKNKPAVLGWGLADDAGDHQSSQEILEFHRKVKAADPEHYTYISVSNWSKKWRHYAHVADLIGGQSYPIGYPFNNRPNNLPSDLSEVNYVLNIGREAASKHHRPVIANLQAFRWKEKQWPTPNEVYNMTYQALLTGVKGIIFYTYGDGESRLTDNLALWDMVKSLVPEIKTLSPALLKGAFTPLNTQFNDLLAGQWNYGKKVYVVVLNTSRTNTRQIAVQIPVKVTGAVQPLFPGRPSGMVFQNGKLSGSIEPEDVHIYQLLRN